MSTPDQYMHDRMLAAAQELVEKTKSGEVQWSLTDDEATFIFTGTKSSIKVTSTVDRDGDRFTTMSLLNQRGTVVESVSSFFMPVKDGLGYDGAPWNKQLDELYFAARRNALGAEILLESLIEDMRSDQPPF